MTHISVTPLRIQFFSCSCKRLYIGAVQRGFIFPFSRKLKKKSENLKKKKSEILYTDLHTHEFFTAHTSVTTSTDSILSHIERSFIRAVQRRVEFHFSSIMKKCESCFFFCFSRKKCKKKTENL